MNVLVVGGTGLIGGTIALYLKEQSHEVTIMARSRPSATALSELPFLKGDYVNDDFNEDMFDGFDSLVFSAAADIRNLPQDGSITADEFYKKSNDEAVPNFFKIARRHGIKRAAYISTFYPQVAPEQVGKCAYVTSRDITDKRLQELSNDDFIISILSAPFVLGHIPDLELPYISALTEYAKGKLELPLFAPPGGTNHMSAGSIAQAALNALDKGESGKIYLLGDENYSWKEYLELWCAKVGNPQELEVRAEDHPILPNAIMFAGVGATISYEPETNEVLKYDRQQVAKVMEEILSAE